MTTLKGQGVANFITGLIGGIPITQVIVLNTTNINGGGQTRMASVFHGLIMLSCWLFLPGLLNLIPLASLAAILIALGYQLTSFTVFRTMYRQGWSQFLPFLSTIITVLFTDILTGVIIGILAGFFFLVRGQNKVAFEKSFNESSGIHRISLGQFVSFLSKGSLQQALENIPENALVQIDGARAEKVDLDILGVIRDFRDHTSKRKNIRLEVVGLELQQL
ncbi:MAG: SulP family inorganic anion transporter [Phaeodactylibacter sp.]|nr:SulP family inorganic anion transporter [Phaeodactylibacter sp.]